jgi:hypothetical protein
MRGLQVQVIICTLLTVLSIGCSLGPQHLEKGHIAYNAAVKAGADDELLLNIVRLRYLDTIDFMTTTSISSQLSFSVSLGGQVGTDLGEKTSIGRGGFSYSTRPTFTFIPLRGQEFAKQLVQPVDLDTLTYLVAADWDLNMLFRLLVRALNDVPNELGLPNPQFRQVTTHLAALQANNKIFVGFVEETEVISDPIDAVQVSGRDLVEAARSGFRFRRKSPSGTFELTATRSKPIVAIKSQREDAKAVVRLLGLKTGGRMVYDLHEGTAIDLPDTERDSIVVRTRSLLGAIFYLTQGVQVPDEHIKQGLTPLEWPPGNAGIDIGDLFQIRFSESKPQADLAVQHRGYWFYISDTDFASRYTFFTLSELVRLGLSQTSGQEAPVLTLPVGGG